MPVISVPVVSVPVFSVVIPVYKDADALRLLLDQLADIDSVKLEIIVSGVSGDSSCEDVADQYRAIYLQGDQGRSRQMNRGAALAKGDYLWFLHADTQLPSNINESLNRIAEIRPSWGFFKVQLSGNRLPFKLVSKGINWRSSLFATATGDQGIFIKRDLWESQVIGYADIPLMEDIELCQRLNRVSRPYISVSTLTTSSRRWAQQGTLATVMQMWRFRLLYHWGVSPKKLAERYYPGFDVTGFPDDNILPSAAYYLEHKGAVPDHREKAPGHREKAPGHKETAPDQDVTIIQFAKTPEQGKVKTRLSSVFDAEDCLLIHKTMIERNLELLTDGPWNYQLWMTGTGDSKGYLEQLENRYKVPVFQQRGSDLGERMLNAAEATLSQGQYVVIIGSDCPYLDKDYLKRLVQQLKAGVDVVFGAASDGGYTAVGFGRSIPELFSDIPWGSHQVLDQSEEALKSAGYFSIRLPVLDDIDHPEDVIAWNQTKEGNALLSKIEFSPVTRLMIEAGSA